jgi:membrane protein
MLFSMKEKKQQLRNRWPVKQLRNYSQQMILPGFDGLALYDVVSFFVIGLLRGAVSQRAKSMAFSFFMAIFPSILFFFTVIPYLPIPNLNQEVMKTLQDVLPPYVFQTVFNTIEDIVVRRNGGWLSVGLILALWFATNGATSMISAFNHTYHAIETRNPFKLRITAMYMVLLIAATLIVATLLIVVGSDLLLYLYERGWIRDRVTVFVIETVKWIVVIAMLFFIISFIYYLAPARRRHFRFISPGSILATILFLLTTLGFDLYVNNFTRYNALYGSIGTIIILLLWIYFNAMILLIGFELNASISTIKRQRGGVG